MFSWTKTRAWRWSWSPALRSWGGTLELASYWPLNQFNTWIRCPPFSEQQNPATYKTEGVQAVISINRFQHAYQMDGISKRYFGGYMTSLRWHENDGFSNRNTLLDDFYVYKYQIAEISYILILTSGIKGRIRGRALENVSLRICVCSDPRLPQSAHFVVYAPPYTELVYTAQKLAKTIYSHAAKIRREASPLRSGLEGAISAVRSVNTGRFSGTKKFYIQM